MVPKMHYTFQY
uniref:Uncharacterized protein n=1 Tax=Anguilla anguilla TaxID=7936 RepID=A0A0E9XTB7_ANGAN